MSSIPSGESLELARLFDQISTRPGAWTTTSIITTFLPIPDAIAFDLQTGCSIGGDFTKLLDRASKTLPEVTESTSILLRIRTLFNRIRSCDLSIEEAFYFPDVKDKIEDPKVGSLLNAARNGDLAILQLYLENGAIISESDRGLAARLAAMGGHEAIVSLLLANGSISEEDRGMAVSFAAENGNVAIVSLLLANGSISESNGGLAARLATIGGHEAIVSLLLANGSISEVYRGLVLDLAEDEAIEAIVSLLRLD